MARTTYSGQTLFIVGGSTGIGLAIARCMVREGANVVLFARNETRLQQAVEALSKAMHLPNQTVEFEVLDAANH